MKLTLIALTVAATMFASSASAADADDLQKLEDTNVCVSCDLYAAILSNADLEGALMTHALMNGAILCNTTMPDGSVIYSGCSKRRL